MIKHAHEVRDPIHVFVRLTTHERSVLDSRPFQRLRHIHQLALSSLVYPGATHKRFEHSLGVMELAGRVFDVVTQEDNIHPDVRAILPEITDTSAKFYWRQVLRMAALCHDIGHLPFSHAAEKELLPDGMSHENLTRALIVSDEKKKIWRSMTPRLDPLDIEKLAVGPKKANDLQFTTWESILSELIVGDAFGVDRIDYLLRDSYHAGVMYGRFDHYRLVDTLRVLPPPLSGEPKSPREPVLGIEGGGLQTAEALAMARYFMYSQVYFHPVRRSYDIHLKDFLKEWLPGGTYPIDVEGHLKWTDNEVWSGILESARASTSRGYSHSRRIVDRTHFRLLYEPTPQDTEGGIRAGEAVYKSAAQEFGNDKVRYDKHTPGAGMLEFPVLIDGDEIASSTAKSQTLRQIPAARFEFVFIAPEFKKKAKAWLDQRKREILQSAASEEEP